MKNQNTYTRIIVSVLAIPLILTVCYLGGYYFLGTFLIIALIALKELLDLTVKKDSNPLFIAGSFSVAAIIFNGFFKWLPFELLVSGIVMLIIFTELYRIRGSSIYNIGSTFIGVFYVGLSFYTLIGIREYFNEYTYGGYMIMMILAGIWLCDSAAFFGGLTFGKHRLYEKVSPKKSWEGAIFGFVFSVLGVVAAQIFLLPFINLTDAFIIGGIIGTIGQMGDLAESLLKSDAGVKDSSNLIPGHGGVFDRFDSLIAVSPVIYIYINLFVAR